MPVEKSRILELVEQGLLTTEEAYVLLENAAKNIEKKYHMSQENEGLNKEDAEVVAEFFREQGDEVGALKIEIEQKQKAKRQIERQIEICAQAMSELDLAYQMMMLNSSSQEKEDKAGKLEKAGTEQEKVSVSESLKNEQEVESNQLKDETLEDESQALVEKIAAKSKEHAYLVIKKEALDTEIAALEARLAEKEGASNGKTFDDILTNIRDFADDLNIFDREAKTDSHSEDKDVDRESYEGVAHGSSQYKEWRQRRVKNEWRDMDLSDLMNYAGRKAKELINGTFKVVTKDGLHVSLVKREFERTFTYKDTNITIIDLKTNNGDVQIESWDQPTIQLEISGCLYGDYDKSSIAETLKRRTNLTVDEEMLKFETLNSFISCDINLKVPNTVLDYLTAQTKLGDISVSPLAVQDAYFKSMSGDIELNIATANALEVETMNGDMKLTNGEVGRLDINSLNGDILIEDVCIHQFRSKTLNGDMRLDGETDIMDINSTSGDVKVTLHNDDIIRANVTTTAGDIKFNVPKSTPIAGLAETLTGDIKFRHPNLQFNAYPGGRHKRTQQFATGDSPKKCDLNLKATSGDIWFKADATLNTAHNKKEADYE